jgi:hypothetical protein
MLLGPVPIKITANLAIASRLGLYDLCCELPYLIEYI